MENYPPVIGKTYSLFGDSTATRPYYQKITELTDEILERFSYDEQQLLNFIQPLSRNRMNLKRISRQNPVSSNKSWLLNLLNTSLEGYTSTTEEHLRSTPAYKMIRDKRLLTNRIQYHLYMIEIELVNRIHKKSFIQSNYKIALLPYCLRETQVECKAQPDEVDYVCKGCLKECYINLVSNLLRENNINPYIWRTAKLKSLFKNLYKRHGSLGVLGIACVVELAWGMRLCMKAGVPVVGIPLNANRCIRWMGEFYENSVDMEELERLLKPD